MSFSRRNFLLGLSASFLATGCATQLTKVNEKVRPKAQMIDLCAREIPGGKFFRVGVDERYSATPGVTQLLSGELMMVWREATDHVNARDGVIKGSRSKDLGNSWSESFLIWEDPEADLRDTCISTDTNGDLWLSYFEGTADNPANGVWALKSSDDGYIWGNQTRISPASLPFAATTSPVVRTDDGLLRHAYYAREVGENKSSIWMASSADNGETWLSKKINDGVADSRDYSEPWFIHKGPTVLCFHRWNSWDALAVTESQDYGATWSNPRKILDNATGRPAAVWLSTGTILLVYRELPSRAASFVRSHDDGRSWFPSDMLMPVPNTTDLGMIYASPLEIDCGLLICPVAIEVDALDCRIWSGYIAEG